MFRRSRIALILFLAFVWALPESARAAQMMTRTLKDKPAIVIAAFGTSTKAQVTYDAFERQLRDALPGYDVRWAFTSEVIRERVNARWAKEGRPDRLKSLQQALADLEAAGYTKAVVQPLHVFPGEEYEEVLRIVERFPGLRIETGEALLQRWERVAEVLEILSADFLGPEEGCNVLAAHGSPQTHVGANIAYLGLDRLVLRRFPNAFVGTVEGILGPENGLEPAKAYRVKRVRFVPLMYVAGDHVMNDIMGDEFDSWKEQVKAAGFTADCPTVELGGERYYKGLGFYPEVNEIFIREIERALGRL